MFGVVLVVDLAYGETDSDEMTVPGVLIFAALEFGLPSISNSFKLRNNDGHFHPFLFASAAKSEEADVMNLVPFLPLCLGTMPRSCCQVLHARVFRD